MAKEIERKFLLSKDSFVPIPSNFTNVIIKQGYIFSDIDKQVRIRLTKDKAIIGIKFEGGLVRDEFEYEIPFDDGIEIYDKCVDKLEKKRMNFKLDGIHYDLDSYPNGLAVVEAEFNSIEEMNAWERPNWIGDEVSGQSDYSNAILAKQNLIFEKEKPLL